MKSGLKLGFGGGIIAICLFAVSCSREHTVAPKQGDVVTNQSATNESEMNRKLSPEETKAFQQTAQAYFGLGVSASEIIILRHQAKGEEIPDSKQLLYEATAFEILN